MKAMECINISSSVSILSTNDRSENNSESKIEKRQTVVVTNCESDWIICKDLETYSTFCRYTTFVS